MDETGDEPGLDLEGHHGRGRTFEEAVEEAYKKVGVPGWYRVDVQFVRVENPVREYKVVITPGG